jgi:hypothetical protein
VTVVAPRDTTDRSAPKERARGAALEAQTKAVPHEAQAIVVVALGTSSSVGVSDPGGPSTGPTSEFIAACPCPDGLAQDGT